LDLIKTVTMHTITIEPFKIIGISVRTTNENGQAAQDIGALWTRFWAEGILERIPDKVDSSIYSVYTNYESDFTKPYDVILGCRVRSYDPVLAAMVGVTIEGGNYSQFTSRGDLTKGAVYNTWIEIWNSGLERKYTTDFEVYGEKAQDPTNGQVDIFIALK
jgi:predicted transcriptional regulator YdeE